VLTEVAPYRDFTCHIGKSQCDAPRPGYHAFVLL
jgi:hypothetical protein